MGAEGAKAPPYIFSAPSIDIFTPLQPLFSKFITAIHPIALERWLIASLVVRFFPSLIRSNQCRPTNFCHFVTKVNKIAKLLDFLVPTCTKLLGLYYDITVKFSPILVETSGQVKAKQQNIKLELASLYPSSSDAAKSFKGQCGTIISTKFSNVIFFGRTNLKLIGKQEKLYPGACSPEKFLKIYMLRMVILELVE